MTTESLIEILKERACRADGWREDMKVIPVDDVISFIRQHQQASGDVNMVADAMRECYAGNTHEYSYA